MIFAIFLDIGPGTRTYLITSSKIVNTIKNSIDPPSKEGMTMGNSFGMANAGMATFNTGMSGMISSKISESSS